MKKKFIPILLTIIVWFIMFYTMLPPINIQSKEFWNFAVTAVLLAIVINMWSIIKGFVMTQGHFSLKEFLQRFKVLVVILAAFLLFYLGGELLSSPILRASAYRELLTIKQSDFKEDIKEVDYTQIPILDKDSAAQLAEREMGNMVDMVSQFEVSDYYSQINYQNRPVRVTPLVYGDEIKWLTNQKNGIPAYIKIDMTTQDVELVKLEEGMKISPSEYFNRDLMRYVRFRYPTAMIGSVFFEIDDSGIPYWICPVQKHTIGLFGGTDIKGIVAVNAVSGEHTYYDVEDVPQWIDKVYEAELLIQQYDYYGKLINGYINSIFGQRGCLQTTEGYNYIALNDDVWVYTGVTSVGGDQSNVGFVLMNQRTKETKYYAIAGAKETSAMSSAEGKVQNLQYKATFPLLLNVGGEPTYFMALKDGAGLVKKYAMVNIQKYQIVATGDSIGECEKEYKKLMNSSGIETVDTSKAERVQGVIKDIKNIVTDGNTYYYIALEGVDGLFEIAVKDNMEILKKNIGDSVSFTYVPTAVEGIHTVTEVK